MKKIRNLLRTWRRIALLLLLVILLACVLCCALLHRALAAETRPGWDILFVIDSSNSMPASYGALHAQTQELLVRYLDTMGQGPVHRVGLIRFGTEGHLELPLTDTAEVLEQRTLHDAWANADALGWTDPLQALDLAYETLAAASRSRPARRQAVILVTDGEPALPTLNDAETRAAYTKAIRDLAARFNRQDILFFTLTLGRMGTEARSAYPTPYRTLWQEMAAATPPASYHELSGVEAIPSVYHEIAAQLVGYASQEALSVPADASPSQALRLPDNLQRAVLTVYAPEAHLQIALRRPGGAPVRAEDPDVQRSPSRDGTSSAVYVIKQPRPGQWTLAHSGESRLQIWIDGRKAGQNETQPAYRWHVVAPDRLLVGTPFEVRCRLIQDGELLSARGDVQITATLLRAGFSERQMLAHVRDGEYVLPLDTLDAGTYTLQVQALQAGQAVAEYETIFAVAEPPRLQVTHPVSGQRVQVGEAITMDARILVPSRPVTAALDVDTVLVIGALQSPNGTPESITLTRDSVGRYVRVVTPTLAGSYSLTLHLQGLTANDLPYADQMTLPFHLIPPPTAPANPWPWIGAGVLTTLTGVGGWLGWRRWQQRPRLEGRWRVLQAPAGVSPSPYLFLPATRQHITLDQTHLPGSSASFSVRAQRGANGETEIWLKSESPNHDVLDLNGHRLTTPVRLNDGDVLEAGAYRLRYENVRQLARRRAVGSD